MSFKQMLKMKLPFTRKGLEDYLDEKLALMQRQFFEEIKEEMNLQFHRRINDVQEAVIRDVRGVREELYSLSKRFPKTMLSFEVALAEHCNLNCVGCNHCAPLASPKFADLEEITHDFRRIAYLFGDRVQQIRLEGGEPLLNRDINKYLFVARDCFPEAEILIITNGLLLPKMDKTFWEACKENSIVIAPTKYPINFDYEAVEELAIVHEVEYRYFDDRAAASQMFWKFPFDIRGRQKCEENFNRCFDGNSCILLKHGHLYTCALAPNAHYLNEAFEIELRESPYDSIDIYEAKSAEEIFEFLAKPIPFCRYCRRDVVINNIPWSQSKRELSEWTL